jgi:hypothetical protein
VRSLLLEARVLRVLAARCFGGTSKQYSLKNFKIHSRISLRWSRFTRDLEKEWAEGCMYDEVKDVYSMGSRAP